MKLNNWIIILIPLIMNSISAQGISDKESIQRSIDSLRQVKVKADSQIKLLVENLSRIEAEENEETYAKSPNLTYPAVMKLKTNVKEANNPFSATVMVLEPGTKVNVKYHENGTYLLAEYQGKHGYIVSASLEEVPIEIQKIKKGRESAKKAKLSSEEKKDLIEKWGDVVARKVSAGQIWIGMTDQMARASIGSPKSINKSTYSFGVREQWIYPKSKYLYFEDGVLKSWQDHK